MKVIQKLSLLLIAVLTFSCADEFIDTEPQANIPGDRQIFNLNTANDALNGLYGGLQSASIYSGDFIYLTTLFADELRHTGSFPSFAEVGANDPSINNIDVQQIWTAHYAAIFRANRIIEIVPTLTENVREEDRNNIIGQALGIRAQLYFNLVRMYGGVPLVTDALTLPTEIDNTNAPRASVSDVFAQINQDVDQAISLLAGFDQSTYRFNRSAARMLKAHVLMEQGQYASAIPVLEAVLDAGFDLAANYSALFGNPTNGTVANPIETIFAIRFTATDGNGMAFFYNGTRGGRFEVTASNFLLNAFEDGDERRNLIVANGSNPQIEKYTRPGDGADDTYVYRLADAILLYAEALARTNDFGEAEFWVNLVRDRAGLGEVTLTAQNFEAIIANERFVELFAEGGGDRYFTTKRMGLLDDLVQQKPNSVFVAARQNLFPIPQQEIERNPAISASDQNPGY
ncbi:MAG: RagB/SusD family nutrient uptake outer membrane protein [Bacteroidetes bacterium]|nr:RagB/SusD family nutrient uptake outer membrane protein [Bacteroidota bacterium]